MYLWRMMTAPLRSNGGPFSPHPKLGKNGIIRSRQTKSLKCLIRRRELLRQSLLLDGLQSELSYVVDTYLTSNFSPRDSITMSRTFGDSNALIDITTSVPRSSDEPGYLRPSPPYVRSQVKCKRLHDFIPTNLTRRNSDGLVYTISSFVPNSITNHSFQGQRGSYRSSSSNTNHTLSLPRSEAHLATLLIEQSRLIPHFMRSIAPLHGPRERFSRSHHKRLWAWSRP